MATSVTVTIEGKQVNITGPAAKAILFIVESKDTINSPVASGTIELHIGGAQENLKAKYALAPAI